MENSTFLNFPDIRERALQRFLRSRAGQTWRKFSESVSLRRQIRRTNEVNLIVGAGGKPQKGWIPTERHQLDLVDRSSWQRWFQPGQIRAILAEHVWEHLDEPDARIAASNCFEFLRPGGYVRCAVPDGFHPSETYIEQVRPGGCGLGADDHRTLYNYQSLSELFASAGFEIVYLEYFNEQGEFNSIDWRVEDGKVMRSVRFDERCRAEPFGYTSLAIDAVKR